MDSKGRARKSEDVVRAVEKFYERVAQESGDFKGADKARALARKWGRRAKTGSRRDDGSY
jgi:hypothetical protein